MSGLTLDAGALIAFERNDRKLVTLLARALERRHALACAGRRRRAGLARRAASSAIGPPTREQRGRSGTTRRSACARGGAAVRSAKDIRRDRCDGCPLREEEKPFASTTVRVDAPPNAISYSHPRDLTRLG